MRRWPKGTKRHDPQTQNPPIHHAGRNAGARTGSERYSEAGESTPDHIAGSEQAEGSRLMAIPACLTTKARQRLYLNRHASKPITLRDVSRKAPERSEPASHPNDEGAGT